MSFWLALLISVSPPFIIGGVVYLLFRDNVAFSFALVGIPLIPLVGMVVGEATEKTIRERVPHNHVRFAKTNTTLLVEYEDMTKTTNDVFAYRNYKDTSKVKVFLVRKRDVWGTGDPELKLELDPEGQDPQSLELSK